MTTPFWVVGQFAGVDGASVLASRLLELGPTVRLGRRTRGCEPCWTGVSGWNLHAWFMTFVPLPKSFYEPSAELVAPRLLGHWLVRRTADGLSGGIVVETEAYLARDPA